MLRLLAPLLLLLPLTLAAAPVRPILGDTRAVAADLFALGSWQQRDGGSPVWRLEVRSAGAGALRLHFTDFQLGEGQLRLVAGGESAGPFRGGGIHGDGDFWAPSLPGESVVIEYQPPGDQPPRLPFQLRELAHFYPPSESKDRERGLEACHVDLATQPTWQAAGGSVALMVFQTVEEGVTFWTVCTGTLLADRNLTNRPLFYTAHHCIHTEEEARTLETYWNFQTTAPGSREYYSGYLPGGWTPTSLPATLPKVTGAHLLVTSSEPEGDGTLLELSASPPAGARFAPVNTEEVPLNALTGTVNHPDGSWKRIASGPRVASTPGLDVDVRVDKKYRPGDYYYKILETLGLTEAGSSGSGLLTTASLVSGALSYGPAVSCFATNRNGIYGRFTHFLPRVQTLLNNLTPGACMADITGGNATVSASSVTGTIIINAPPTCYWAVASDYPHIQVNFKSGSGPGIVVFQINANTDPVQLTQARVGTVSVITEERRVFHYLQRGTGATSAYVDVANDHPFATEINFLQRRNVHAYGCAATGGFCPEAATTRGQMAEFIIRSLFNGDNFQAPQAALFTDVTLNHPAFQYVQKLKEVGITAGCSATAFCPDDPVTRGQMAAFIVRAIQYLNRKDSRADFSYHLKSYFTDNAATNVFFAYIQEMKELGVTSGCSGTAYCINDPNTRGQIAVFLTRGLYGLWEGR